MAQFPGSWNLPLDTSRADIDVVSAASRGISACLGHLPPSFLIPLPPFLTKDGPCQRLRWAVRFELRGPPARSGPDSQPQADVDIADPPSKPRSRRTGLSCIYVKK